MLDEIITKIDLIAGKSAELFLEMKKKKKVVKKEKKLLTNGLEGAIINESPQDRQTIKTTQTQ